MKIAIISVSNKGLKIAFNLKKLLDKESTIIKTDLYHKDVKNTFKLIFSEYDAVIAIMASGILIRSIAPLINSKDKDPAIINIDDNGQFVISTLSGHLGGANSLTSKIAELLNATAVITTSTDVNKKLGIDVLARDLYLKINDTSEILYFNKAILDNQKIKFILNPNRNYDYLFRYLKNNTLEINVSYFYSDKINCDEIHVVVNEHEIILKEKKLVVGIGCKKNKSSREIFDAVINSLDKLNLSSSRVNYLSSASIKKDEKGILDLSNDLNIPVYFVSMDKMKLFENNNVSKSEFVKSKFGIYGVCEPAALITAGFESKLIFKKTSYNGVTIAISVSD